jgi:hypothetical protein
VSLHVFLSVEIVLLKGVYYVYEVTFFVLPPSLFEDFSEVRLTFIRSHLF